MIVVYDDEVKKSGDNCLYIFLSSSDPSAPDKVKDKSHSETASIFFCEWRREKHIDIVKISENVPQNGAFYAG